jgi:type 1 glutamine amidotransferase
MKTSSILPLFFGLAFCASPALAIERTPEPAGKIVVPPTAEWRAKVKELAPAKPRVKPKAQRKVLVFSLMTGYKHAVNPYVKEVMDILASTGAFEVVHSADINDFAPEKLKNFDAVALNNTCSKGPRRNMFLDALDKRKDMTDARKKARAEELEKSLEDFVASGKGLVVVHGAIVFLNESKKFKEMAGASFIRHPRRQHITLKLVEPDHPLVAAFKGEEFAHNDEPYLFSYYEGGKDLRPLLEMDLTSLDKKTQKNIGTERRYVSWIKKYGKGRVFFVSPSHQPESYESARLLQFYLDGIQYALGDFPCDDSPAK